MEESHGEIVEEEIRAVTNDRSQVVNSQQVVDNVEYKSTLNSADDDEVGATQLPPNAAIHPSTTSNIDHGATTDTPMVQTGSLNSFVAAGINKVEHRDERIKGRAKCNVTRPGVAEFVAISARHTTTERKSAKGTTITSRSSTPSGKASHVDRMKAPAVDPGNNSPQQREIIVALDEEVCVNDNSPIVAIAVDGDDEKEKVYAVAVRFDPGSDSSAHHHRYFRIYRIVGATIFLISLAIAIYFAIADRDDDPPDFTLPITVRPTFSPTSGREKVYMDLFAEFVGDKVFTLNTPHSSAAKWIISEDPLKLKRNNPKLLQRYLLAFLYFHTTGNTVTRWKSCNPPARNQSDTCRNIGNKDVRPNTTISRWLSGQDECTWAGVQCYQRYFVENIFLGRDFTLQSVANRPTSSL